MVKRWSAVTRALWNDRRFLGLSCPEPNAQTLWLYLLTGPHQGPIPGLFSAGVGSLADGLGWERGVTEDCLREIEDAGMAKTSSRPPLIFLPRAVLHNPPANPNVVIGWGSWFQELPECELRDEAAAEIRSLLKPSLHEAFDRMTALARNGSGNRYPNRSPNRYPNGSPNGFGNRSGKGMKKRTKRASVTPPDKSPSDPDPPSPTAEQSPERNGYPNGYPNGYRNGSPNGYRNQDQDQDQKIRTSKHPLAKVLTEELRDAISSHSSEYISSRVKPKNLRTWEVDIDRLLRLDKAEPTEVQAVIRWIHLEDPDNFWRPNILSGKKLRAQWPRLRLQANQKGILKAAAQSTSAKAWLEANSQWLLREGQKLEAMSVSITPCVIQEAARRDGLPIPSTEVASKAATWAAAQA